MERATTHQRRLARPGWRCSLMAIQCASRAGSRGGGARWSHDEEAGEADEEGGDEARNNPLHGAGRPLSERPSETSEAAEHLTKATLAAEGEPHLRLG